ncbi:tripartite tricarboxylate transporter permease [Mycobacterium sp. NPDC003449]
MLDNITAGLGLLLQPAPLMWLVIGVSVGFIVGVLPGLSTSNTAALLLPFAITLPLENSLVLIVSIYAGAQFGGAVPAILFNVPGEAGSAVTALDGYPLAKKGQAGLAIGIARMASVLGGVISGFFVLFLLQPLGTLSLKFGAREMFAIIVLGLVVASSLMGGSARKGLMVGLLGLMFAVVGVSPGTAETRYTFGELQLYDGIQFLAALIGVFAISEMLMLVGSTVMQKRQQEQTVRPGGLRKETRDAIDGVTATLRQPGAVARSTGVGIILGIIPGLGAAVANFISYSFEKRRSPHPEEFGKGSHKGIIASEACDNAVAASSLIPTFTLGIPGSATMAVVLAAFYLQGIQPGPRVLQTNNAEVYAVALALIVASIMILPLGVLLAGPLASVTKVPLYFLVPTVLFMSMVGVYAIRNSIFDVGLALFFGVIGLLLRLNDYPVIPLILGIILGPLAEEYLQRSLELADGPGYFFGSIMVNILWVLLIAALAAMALSGVRQRRKDRTAVAAEPVDQPT